MSEEPILFRLASLEDDLRQSKYAPFSEDPREVVKDAHEEIRQLRIEVNKVKAQLAARNQAAEAMGVLERLVPDKPTRLCVMWAGGEIAIWDADSFGSLCDVAAVGNSLIEAVLKAGGEDAPA